MQLRLLQVSMETGVLKYLDDRVSLLLVLDSNTQYNHKHYTNRLLQSKVW